MNDYWEELVEQAAAGDTAAARRILEEFSISANQAVSLRRPELVPLPLAKYVGDAFRQVLDGIDPEKALHLVGKSRGRRKGKSVTHDLEAVAAAFSLLTRHGFKPEEANRVLQERVGTDRATVHRARRENQAFEYWIKTEDGAIKALVDEEALELMAVRGIPHLSAILESRRTKSR